jgi:hypothetical protein
MGVVMRQRSGASCFVCGQGVSAQRLATLREAAAQRRAHLRQDEIVCTAHEAAPQGATVVRRPR